MDDTSNPTWGYKADGSAEIFDLAPGEGLPAGWDASPSVITDPDYATAEALTARAAGRSYVPPIVSVDDADHVGVDELADALAKIERLKGIITTGGEESADLVTQVEAAEEALDKAVEDLTALRAALGTAETDRANAVAATEALAADLAAARADLEALTAPAANASAAKPGKAK